MSGGGLRRAAPEGQDRHVTGDRLKQSRTHALWGAGCTPSFLSRGGDAEPAIPHAHTGGRRRRVLKTPTQPEFCSVYHPDSSA